MGGRRHFVSGKPTRTAKKAKMWIATLSHQKFRQPTLEVMAPAMMGPSWNCISAKKADEFQLLNMTEA